MDNSNKNVKIVSDVYVYENAFKNDSGDLINYSQLAVDVQIGDTKLRLTRKLRGFENEYIKSLISADNAFGDNGDLSYGN